jgi:non-specific serine/threonine protein kinase/serine/threonine-protein kinase
MVTDAAEGPMDVPESEADPAHDEPSQPTLVLGTEFFESPVDPVLELLNRWEEYRRLGEEPPADWTVGIDPRLREELDRRIQRRKRLNVLLELTAPGHQPGAGADVALPAFPGHQTLRKIGRGGMGAVYQARDTDLDRLVAIKTIAEGQLATQDQRERFRAEARAVARLRHPNLITIHAVGEHEAQPYLILEYAAGGSLAGRLAEKPMTPREAAALLETLARAVHAAHQAGVVHRDLKPSNILLTAEGVPKVSDFGLAKLMDADVGRTVTGQVLGSPSFMAPEQAEGRTKDVGPAADVYALGSILYQALTGRPPFLGESQLETLKLVVSNDVVPPRRLRPDVPRDLETICLRCLEKEPSRRYPDALALADDLRRHFDNRPIVARRTGPVERGWRCCRRNPGLAGVSLTAAALMLVLIIGAVASAMIYRDQRDQIADDLGRIRRSEAEARTERDRAVAAESKAERSRSEMRAVLEFLQNKVLAAARPKDREGGLGREVSLRAALDAAESGIGNAFKDQTAVEASIRTALGETYYYLGEPERAQRQTERAVALRRQALGQDHPDTLAASGNLAHFYMDVGRVDEAIALLADSLARRQAGLGPDHPETITSKNDLAVVYQAAGRLREALPLYEEALRQRRAKLGSDHPDTMFSINNLASAYRSEGRFSEALPLYQEALDRRRTKLGPDHPETLMSMNNLANFYRELGRYPESISLQEETLAKQRDRLGPDHPDTLLSMSNLAIAYQNAGRTRESLPLLEETLRRRRSKLGPDHPETLVSMSNLAVGYREAGRLADALPLLEEALERRRATRGPDHPQTLRSANNLAFVYLATRPALAEPLLREALSIREKKLPDDWSTFEAQSLLGGSLLAQKKYAEAEPYLIRGYEGLKSRAESIPAPSRKVRPEALERIVRLYQEWGKKDKAEEWRNK